MTPRRGELGACIWPRETTSGRGKGERGEGEAVKVHANGEGAVRGRGVRSRPGVPVRDAGRAQEAPGPRSKD